MKNGAAEHFTGSKQYPRDKKGAIGAIGDFLVANPGALMPSQTPEDIIAGAVANARYLQEHWRKFTREQIAAFSFVYGYTTLGMTHESGRDYTASTAFAEMRDKVDCPSPGEDGKRSKIALSINFALLGMEQAIGTAAATFGTVSVEDLLPNEQVETLQPSSAFL